MLKTSKGTQVKLEIVMIDELVPADHLLRKINKYICCILEEPYSLLI